MISKSLGLITVYSKDGDPYQMEEGSTVLDFAFRIHPDLACSACYAYIRRGNSAFNTIKGEGFNELVESTAVDVDCEINQLLQDGDYVLVVGQSDDEGKPVYRAKYEWFSYTKTPYATEKLIEFFGKMAPLNGEYPSVVKWEPGYSKKFKEDNNKNKRAS